MVPVYSPSSSSPSNMEKMVSYALDFFNSYCQLLVYLLDALDLQFSKLLLLIEMGQHALIGLDRPIIMVDLLLLLEG